MIDKQTPRLSWARARFAYRRVSEWEGQPWKKEAVNLAKSLPIVLRMQGMAVSLANLIRMDSAQSRELARTVSDWLLKDWPLRASIPSASGGNDPKTLLVACIEAEALGTYLALQREALALMEQIKLFGDALYGQTEQ